MNQLTEEIFLKDVENHRMEIIKDDGVHRHIRFRQPGTICQGFDLVTWPGYLCYTGDMGTYVFARLVDMFEFFRGPSEGDLKFNLGYWAEKCEGVDRHDGLKNYSPDKFRAEVNRWLDDIEASEEIREAVSETVLPEAENGGYAAMQAALDFAFDGKAIFQDFWEVSLDELSDRFIWCCYALAWGIWMYDREKQKAAVVEESA